MKKDIKSIIVIFLFAISYFLIMPNYFFGDDSIFHTSNIISIAKTNTLFIPKILPLIEGNLGYGVNLFYPPLPHLIGSYIYRIINNIGLTMQILEFFSIFLAGISIYYYTKIVFKNKTQALITSFFYMSMPYLLTDAFSRTALNEAFIFYILPIIFLSFHYLKINDIKKFYIFFIIGFSLGIYTHLVLTIYITMVSCFYLIYNYKILNKNNILHLIKASLIVIGITSPFTFPLIEHYLLNAYSVFKIEYEVGEYFFTDFWYVFVFPVKRLSGADNTLRFHVNPISLLFFANIYFQFYKRKVAEEHKNILSFLILLFILTVIFESNISVWAIFPNLLRNIQFPWRLSIFTSFSASILAGHGIKLWKKKYSKYLLIILSITLLFTDYYYLNEMSKHNVEKEFLNTRLDENISWQEEYLPLDSVVYKEYLNKIYEIIETNPNIKILNNDVPNLTIEVNNIKEETFIDLPRIYYKGYALRGKNNKKAILNYGVNGMLEATFKENGIYKLTYEGTTIYKISLIIRIISIVLFIKMIKKLNYKK